MKCLDCGREMEKGTVTCVGAGFESYYEFTSEKEAEKKGLKGFFTKKTITVPYVIGDSQAWHCPECKKVMMWLDSKE